MKQGRLGSRPLRRQGNNRICDSIKSANAGVQLHSIHKCPPLDGQNTTFQMIAA
jgi:hypothetical protein